MFGIDGGWGFGMGLGMWVFWILLIVITVRTPPYVVFSTELRNVYPASLPTLRSRIRYSRFQQEDPQFSIPGNHLPGAAP